MGNPCKARSGGVFRDHQSCWLLGYSRNLGQASNIVAEFWGLREGLISHGFSYLDIEFDAKVVLDLLLSVLNITLCLL